jgi:hypothetical protein
MSLKYEVNKLEDLPESVREHYTKVGDKFHLTIDGPVPKPEEFRQTNTRLMAQVAEQEAKLKTFDGIDPSAVAADREKLKELDTTKVQLATATADLATERAARTAAQTKADGALLRDTITAKALAIGARPDAVSIVADKAAAVFVVEGESLKAKAGVFSKNKPGEPLGVQEWLEGAIKEFPFLWKESSGSGSAPRSSLFRRGGGSGPGVITNPTPSQLGDPATAEGIRTGRIRVEYTT